MQLLYRECNYFNFNARYPYKLFAFLFLKSALFPPNEIDYSSVTVRKWNRQLCFERSNTEKLKIENRRETINMDRFYKSTDNGVDSFQEASSANNTK